MSTTDTAPDTSVESVPEDPERPETDAERRARRLAAAGPVDRALMSRPMGGPPRYEPRLRTVDQLTLPPLSLNPESITKLDGYEDHGTQVFEAVGALEAMQSAVKSTIEGREKSKLDPTMNESAAVLAVGTYASKLMTPATVKVDTALKIIAARITAAEGELRSGIASGTSTMAPEIRAYCRSLPNAAERGKFISSLIDAGDTESLAAILRGKPFLSGLTQQLSDAFVEQFNRRRRPELPARIDLMKKVQTHLEGAGSQFALHLEGAMGVRWNVVQRLREAKSAAAFG